jgi:hypothetical protein
MNLPPLNQTLWTLLIALLSACAGWTLVSITSRIERQRQERHRDRLDETQHASAQPPRWYLVLRLWLR